MSSSIIKKVEKVEQHIDYLDYKRYSQKVKQYLENFTFLHAIASLNINQILPFIQEVFQTLSDDVRKSKLYILKSFKYLVWSAWKGRQEYKIKYNQESDQGHEYQIKLLNGLYQKVHLCLRTFSDKKKPLVSREDQPAITTNKYQALFADETEVQAEIEAEVSETKPTLQEDIDLKIETDPLDEKSYLKLCILASKMESLICVYLGFIFVDVFVKEYAKLVKDFSLKHHGNTAELNKKVQDVMSIWLLNIFNKKLGITRFNALKKQLIKIIDTVSRGKSRISSVRGFSYMELRELILVLFHNSRLHNETSFGINLLPQIINPQISSEMFNTVITWMFVHHHQLVVAEIATNSVFAQLDRKPGLVLNLDPYKSLFQGLTDNHLQDVEKLFSIKINQTSLETTNAVTKKYTVNDKIYSVTFEDNLYKLDSLENKYQMVQDFAELVGSFKNMIEKDFWEIIEKVVSEHEKLDKQITTVSDRTKGK